MEKNIADLTPSSNQRIKLVCDYCGKQYDKKYCDYTKQKQVCIVESDSCVKETINKKYGCDNVFQLDRRNTEI